MRWVLGIDPGLDGALAFFCPMTCDLEIHDMPTLEAGAGGKRVVAEYALAELIRSFQARPGVELSTAYLERVASRPGESHVASFSFGTGYGILRGVLAALGVTISDVQPQTWKKFYGLKGGKAEKDQSRAKAMALYPFRSSYFVRKKDNGRAEAVLIAAYGCR